jgi:hypothetical protein
MADDADRASKEEMAADNEGLLSSEEVRTGFISGLTFVNKPVQYAVAGDLAIFEGCICLGTVDEMERTRGLVQASATGPAFGLEKVALMERTAALREESIAGDQPVVHGVVITGERYRWPNGLMPYEFDAGLPNATRQRVNDAINHWQTNTSMRFVLRTAANASQYPNFVRVFRPVPGSAEDGCWSYVGMQGGMQRLALSDGCGFVAAVHEFGHAWGLWHEQSREDRDSFVTIHWANIQPGREHNFNQHISDGDDVGPYDYGSIMHYGRFAFSRNSQPTISAKQAGVTVDQATGLTAGDIAAVHHIYRTMQNNLTVAQVYATPHPMNAWAYVTGARIHAGWRKVHVNARDGVTNTFRVLALARAYGRKVNCQLDGGHIYQVYGT